MKRKILFITLICFVCARISSGQTIVFHEDFEVMDSMTSTGSPAWFPDAVYATNGTHSVRDTVGINGTAYLTSNTFSTIGNFFVLFTFDQICKISFADQGYVEVSNDNGNSWITMTGNNYLGSSTYFSSFGYFASFSYGPTGWDAAHDLAVPQSNWWRTELFDISSVAANSAQVKVRFRITDGNGNGNSGNYGWLIDRVIVQAAPHELVPPSIAWAPPVLQGTLYSTGPFIISDTIRDASAIDTAILYYTVNGSLPVAVAMTNSGNIYHGTIPAVNVGDTVCYYVQASDIWGNTSVLPASGCQSFVTSLGISIPYFDSFDGTNTWDDSTVSGSHWELGTPSFGVTTGAHSPPNAWDIDLASGYEDNSLTYLISPIFNFIGVTDAELSFWRNHNCESGWDGVRVECTTNGITWWLLGRYGDPRGTNWYNETNINSNPGPAFSGISNGWVQSKYKLDTLNNVAGPVQFRFVFTSDPSITRDGISIDDISIAPRPAQDIGVVSFLRPGLITTANTSDTVKVVIHNYGSAAAANFPVAYRINSGSVVTQTFAGALQPNASATVMFMYSPPAGPFTVCAWTSLTGDGYPLNDTLCKSSFGEPVYTLMYSDNFDTGTSFWHDSSTALGTNWQQGTPAFGQTTGSYSPPSCWDLNLTTTYTNNSTSCLISPIFDFTGITVARLAFWQNMNVEDNYDGMRLEYSVDEGVTWTLLGVLNDPNAINWYTDGSIVSSGLPGWTNISISTNGTAGWQQCTYLNLPSAVYGHLVLFRFVFTSDNSVTHDGISIDNFQLWVPLVDVPAITNLAGTFRIYPNPSSGIFYLQADSRMKNNSSITVADILGNRIWRGTLNTTNQVRIDLSSQPDGIYFVSVVSDGRTMNQKIILCR